MKKEDLWRAIGEADDSLLERSETPPKVSRFPLKKWAATAACLCLVTAAVLGAPRLLPRSSSGSCAPGSSAPEQNYFASSPAPNISETIPGAAGATPADSPPVPECTAPTIEIDIGCPQNSSQPLSWKEAAQDPDFGAYLPPHLPVDFSKAENGSYENYERSQTGLHLSWVWNQQELWWNVRRLEERDGGRICSPGELEKYDLSRYPIPRCDSVPEDLQEVVDDPIFRAEELTLDMVKARTEHFFDAGDTSGPRIHFSVLYGDILVAVSAKGLSPDWIYDQLTALILG